MERYASSANSFSVREGWEHQAFAYSTPCAWAAYRSFFPINGLNRRVRVGKNLVCVFQRPILRAYRLFLKNARWQPLKWACLLARNGKNGFQKKSAFIALSNGVWTLRDNDVFLKSGRTFCRTFSTCGPSTFVICSARNTTRGSRERGDRGGLS